MKRTVLVIVAALICLSACAPSAAYDPAAPRRFSAESTPPVEVEIVSEQEAFDIMQYALDNGNRTNLLGSAVLTGDVQYEGGYHSINMESQPGLPDYAWDVARKFYSLEGIESIFECTYVDALYAVYLNAVLGGENPLYKEIDRVLVLSSEVAPLVLVDGEWDIDSIVITEITGTQITATAECILNDIGTQTRTVRVIHESDGWRLDESFAVSYSG